MPRHLAIGDIHGCYRALRTLCDFVELRDDDVIITLGDYGNRGPDTRAVLEWLLQLEEKYDLKPLRGNHDVRMLRARKGKSGLRELMTVGGGATLKSYSSSKGNSARLADIPKEHWEFLKRRLLPYFETETHFFVHANADPKLPLAEQSEETLYWESFNDPPLHQSGKIMVCGHTSQKSGRPRFNGNAICIDTWACGNGWLSCLDVDSGTIWQASQKGKTRHLSMEDL
ncbi:diadenosine tetraphosphatase [Planctomycetes bacterium Pan216]|uniref:Diadenosine tetraphosphatase n=1 Tax=Kolteria novifilia TaxID=2527975 RepID=A0A518B5V9_9BACT|nr:diadenosine tetraphosphatase [Planctomycetes bacterium Pan216]